MDYDFEMPVMVAGVEATRIAARATIVPWLAGDPRRGHDWTIGGIFVHGHVKGAGGRRYHTSRALATTDPDYQRLADYALEHEWRTIDSDWRYRAVEEFA